MSRFPLPPQSRPGYAALQRDSQLCERAERFQFRQARRLRRLGRRRDRAEATATFSVLSLCLLAGSVWYLLVPLVAVGAASYLVMLRAEWQLYRFHKIGTLIATLETKETAL